MILTKKYAQMLLAMMGFLLVMAKAQGQAPCAPPNVTNGQNSCSTPGSVTLRAQTIGLQTGQTVTHKWYTSSTGSATINATIEYVGTNSIHQTKVVANSTIDYWVSAVVDGCESSRRKVSATILSNATPTLSAYLPSNNVCGSGSFAFTASGGHTNSEYRWYNAPSGGTKLHTGSVYNVSLSSTTILYVEGSLKSELGCNFETTRIPVTATVKPLPAIPNASDVTLFCAGSATLTASGIDGASYRWYNMAGNEVQAAGSGTYSTPVLTQSTSYQVEAIVNGCVGARKTVQVTIDNSSLLPPAVTNGANSCTLPNSALLSATSTVIPPNTTIKHRWYSSATGTSYEYGLVGTSSPYTTTKTVNANSDYWVATEFTTSNGICVSNRVKVSATFTSNATPVLSTFLPTNNTCGEATFQFQASGGASGSVYRWFEVASGGTAIHTGPTYTTILSTTTTLYVEGTLKSELGCDFETTRIPVTGTVLAIPPLPIANDVTIFCEGTATLTAGGISGALYRWYDMAGNEVQAAGAGTYITSTLTQTTSYQVEAIVNSCVGPRKTVQVIIDPSQLQAPFVSGASNTCASPNEVTLTATTTSIPAGMTIKHRWYITETGNGFDYGAAQTTSPYISAYVAYQTQDYWVATELSDAQGNIQCISNRVKVSATITDNTAPQLYIPTPRHTTCKPTETFNLIATGGQPGSIYRWYDAETGGNLLGTTNHGEAFAITTSQSNTYYVEGDLVSNLGCAFNITERQAIYVEVGVNKTVPSPNFNSIETVRCGIGDLTLSVYNEGYYSGFIWKKDGVLINNANTSSVTINLSQVDQKVLIEVAGTFTNAGCGAQSTFTAIEVMAVSNCENYVHETVNRKKGTTTEALLDALPLGDRLDNWSYFDGLGRPMQNVNVGQSPEQKDIVQPIVYDEFGRTIKTYLPYVATGESANGLYRDNATVAIPTLTNFYKNQANIANDDYPYNKQEIEFSPLARVMKVYAPGESWVGVNKGVTQNYLVNLDPGDVNTLAGDKIRVLRANNLPTSGDVTVDRDIWYLKSLENDANSQLITDYKARTKIVLEEGFTITSNDPKITLEINAGDKTAPIIAGFYDKGELAHNRTTDEDGKVTEQFTNKAGQVLVKRAKVDNDSWAQTYYVYDDFGRLSYVLPPEAVKLLDEHKNQNDEWDFAHAVVCEKLPRLWYRYYYDTRGRMIIKEVPGSGKMMMVYDKRDRLVLSQDAKQRALAEWSFTKYDELNRPVITGLYPSSQTRTQLQTSLDNNFGNTNYLAYESFDSNKNGNHLYTDGAFPQIEGVAGVKIHSVTYYDNYDWKSGSTYNYVAIDAQLATEPITYAVQGQVTATKTAILDGFSNATQYLTTVSYYDERDRVLQTVADNHLGGVDRTATQYAFDGRVLQSVVHHATTAPTRSYYVTQWNSYDHIGRVTRTYQEIKDSYTYRSTTQAETAAGTLPTTGVEKISELTYNELGQLMTKNLGQKLNPGGGGTSSVDPLQTLDFKYNIRGWMTHLNDAGLSTSGTGAGQDNDLFGFELLYDKKKNTTAGYLNGNIVQMVWQSKLDEVQRQYDYTYDGLNRLKTAIYSSATHSTENNRYNVENITYDLNGNIKTLTRRGMIDRKLTLEREYGVMDQLSYVYRGNQLLGVTDATNEGKTNDDLNLPLVTGAAGDFRDGHTHTESDPDYRYDVNGNMITDKNKEIETIQYNHLNLPTIINFSGERRIEYTYDAAGIKLKKEVYEGVNLMGITNYVGSFVYEDDNLQFIHTAEGRALAPGSIDGFSHSDFLYEYHYKDHLGNLRMAFREGQMQTYQATLEDVVVDKQQGFEYNADSIRVANPTNAAQYSAKLTSTHPLGMLRNVEVSQGDVVTVKVKGYYNEVPTNNQAVNWGLVLGNLTNTTGNTNSGEVSSQNSPFVLNLGLTVTPNSGSNPDGQIPSGYLKTVFYDKDGNPQVGSVQYQFLQTGLGQWQDLELTYTAPARGYVQVFVANESDQDVYFDDMVVEHTPQLIVQENHYYPFGMNLAGIEKQGKPEHKFQYNGKEKQEEFGLNWLDYGARNYDAVLGRWFGVDELSEKYYPISPYAYVANNPMIYRDPNGKEIRADVTTRYDKKTKTTHISVTFHFTGKVLNNSSSRVNISELAADITNRLNKALKGKLTVKQGTGKVAYDFNVGSVNVQGVRSADEVNDKDHLIVVVDDVTGTTKDKNGRVSARGGVAKFGAKVAYIEPDQGGEGAVHELGHNFRLNHNWDAESPDDAKSDKNYMSYATGQRNSFSPKQLKSIFQKRFSLSKGKNTKRVTKNDFNYARTTTEKIPYKGVNRGQKVPVSVDESGE